MLTLTHRLKRESSHPIISAPVPKQAKLSQAMKNVSSTGMQPASLASPIASLSPVSMPLTLLNTCLATLWNRLNDLKGFANKKDFQHKQIWVEDLLATLPLEELKKVEKITLDSVFVAFQFKFDVSEITIRNAFQAIKAEPDDEQREWFTAYVTANTFRNDGDKVIETRWVKKCCIKDKRIRNSTQPGY